MLRTWFADPATVPVYLALSALALLLALSVEPKGFGWTLSGVYLALSGLAMRVQRTVSTS
jgi:hypothetical protein